MEKKEPPSIAGTPVVVNAMVPPDEVWLCDPTVTPTHPFVLALQQVHSIHPDRTFIAVASKAILGRIVNIGNKEE